MSLGWAVILIVILGAHNRHGYGAKFVCPVSSTGRNLFANLFLGETGVIHLNTNKTQTPHEAQDDVKEIISSWRRLLIASGGVLKPIKYLYSLISFNWKSDEKWEYASDKKDNKLAIGFPTPE